MATPLEALRSWTRIGQLEMQAVEDWSVATLTAAHLPMGRGQRRGGKRNQYTPWSPAATLQTPAHTYARVKLCVSVARLHAARGGIIYVCVQVSRSIIGSSHVLVTL